MLAKALTIAGSDSGGGAGIQADLKTFSALKIYGMAVIAALTAQNTIGVRAVMNVPADFVDAQLAIDALGSVVEGLGDRLGPDEDARRLRPVGAGEDQRRGSAHLRDVEKDTGALVQCVRLLGEGERLECQASGPFVIAAPRGELGSQRGPQSDSWSTTSPRSPMTGAANIDHRC